MINLTNATVSFATIGDKRQVKALAGINLVIPDGEFVTLVGTNGAGKSTLLNVLAGTVALTTGRMEVDGVDVSDVPDFQRAKWMARVFPDPRVGTCDLLTVEENLAIAASKGRCRGLGRALNAADRQMFSERLKELKLGLEGRMNTPMRLLSSGQRQSITVLMATLSTPKLLLLDEHIANLDPRTQTTVMELSDRTIRSMRLSAVMVTHDVQTALTYGDRLLALKDGRIILDAKGASKAALTVADIAAVYQDEYH